MIGISLSQIDIYFRVFLLCRTTTVWGVHCFLEVYHLSRFRPRGVQETKGSDFVSPPIF